MSTRDPRETYAAALSACFVACIFMYVLIVGVLAPPRHTVVINEVFEITYTVNRQGQAYTNVYTVGQGQYYFQGTHSFQIGCSYHVVYVEHSKRWRDLTLLDWVEVHIPG